MDDLKAVTLELLRMFSGGAFHNSGPDFANALSPYPSYNIKLTVLVQNVVNDSAAK